MFEEFFNKCEIQYPETVTAEQSEKIKASLRKMVGENPQIKKTAKEGNNMKTKTIRTVVIAAAVAALGAAGIAASANISSNLVRQQVIEELEEQNRVGEGFLEHKGELIGTGGISPSYEDMKEINKLVVTEATPNDFKLISDMNKGILLRHEDSSGSSVTQIIVPDDSGGYRFVGYEFFGFDPIEDEKLLNAIAEGTEEYGESFIIWY